MYVIMLKANTDCVLQAVLETVAKITHEKRNDTQEAKCVNVKWSFNVKTIVL